MSKKKTHEEYVAELAIKNPTVKVVEQYIDTNTPIAHYCTIHNITWDMAPHNALQGKGCKECGKMKLRNQRKKPNEQYKQELAKINPNVIALGEYINMYTPITHYCLVHDVIWDTSPASVLQGCGCKECWREKMKEKMSKTTEQYIEELAMINPNIMVLEDYVGARVPILHKCKLDGCEWKAVPNHILEGHGCPECGKRILSDLKRMTHEEYVKRVAICNPNIEVLGEYTDSKTSILHKCKIDGTEWMAKPANILYDKGCPTCKQSKGEKIIAKWLDEHNVQYIPQNRFSDCKDTKPLPFDFYLTDYNTCIEFDGPQHFEPIDFAGKGEEWAQKQLEKTQYHDQIKNTYCANKNIPLLRISYCEDIEEELNNFLFI